MSFAIICTDREGALEIRKANRDAHLAYVAETGVVSIAGPFMDDAGNMNGSLLVLEVPDRAAAEAWCAGDPYAKADLFESVTIRAWKKVRG